MIQQIDRQLDVNRIIDIFSELTTISATFRKEAQVANYVKQFLSNKAFTIHEDDAGKSVNGNSGNLIIVPERFNPELPATALLAHMDTIRDTGSTNVVVANGRIHSSGNTQLGADNRLGMALLLWFLEQISEAEVAPNVAIVFTIGEEAGMIGAKQLDLKSWNVHQALTFDSSLRPGKYISESAGMYLFEVTFEGVAVHSAVSNGTGIHAILMASEAVTAIMQLPVNSGITRNIGLIKGGEATNIIPATCSFYGEVRGFTKKNITEVINKYKNLCKDVARAYSGKVSWKESIDFEPYIIDENEPVRVLLEKVLLESELQPEPVVYSGGSDANALNTSGIASINIGIGAQNPHSDNEFVLLDDIKAMMNFLLKLQQNLT